MYARYRGHETAIPVADSLDTLKLHINHRVKPGLKRLLQTTHQNPVEYAGYAFKRITTPLQKMEFVQGLGGSMLVEALKDSGLNVNSKGRHTHEDFWIEPHDCFSAMTSQGSHSVWRQRSSEDHHMGAFGSGGLEETNFLLGPVVCGPYLGVVDDYNQNKEIDFDSGAAVHMSGQVLLRGLYEYDPELHKGYAVSEKQIAEYFTDTFSMYPLHGNH